MNLIKDLERKETEYMRLKRNRICVNDFELLTIIGRGAYGEVSTPCIIHCNLGCFGNLVVNLIAFGIYKNLHVKFVICLTDVTCSCRVSYFKSYSLPHFFPILSSEHKESQS